MPAYFVFNASRSSSFFGLAINAAATLGLGFVLQRTNGSLCVIRCPHSIYKIGKKEIRPLKLHIGRDAAKFPVVDALCAALFWVTKESCNFGCAAKALDELPVLVWGGVVRVHGDIKHHV